MIVECQVVFYLFLVKKVKYLSIFGSVINVNKIVDININFKLNYRF